MSRMPTRLATARTAFRQWRRSRPFWAGLVLILSAAVIMIPPYAAFRVGDAVVAVRTLGGVSALLIGVLLLLCAGSLWIRPRFRVAAGVMALLAALLALVVSNLGGLLVGSLLGLSGAALALSWTERAPESQRHRRWHRLGAGLLVVLATGLPAGLGAGVAPAPLALASSRTTAPPDASGQLPGRTWRLMASHLRLGGLRYHGITTTTVNGHTVPVLHFTADDLDLSGVVLNANLGNGQLLTIRASAADATARRDRPVRFLVRRIAGNLDLLGLPVPVDFSPANPPPLVLPQMAFSDVFLVNTDLANGTLILSRARVTLTDK